MCRLKLQHEGNVDAGTRIAANIEAEIEVPRPAK
jgi:streptomycin 6-kinase